MGSGTDRSFQQGGARSSGLCPPSPSGLYSPPAPVPSPPLLIICPIPIPWCLGTAVSWSIPAIILSLLSYYVPSQSSACMLFMLCMRARGFCGVITAWFRCGFTCLITLNRQRWKEGQGCRLSYYAACVILTMNNVGEQRVEINFQRAAEIVVWTQRTFTFCDGPHSSHASKCLNFAILMNEVLSDFKACVLL